MIGTCNKGTIIIYTYITLFPETTY